jgi:uroporphyrin-III C-methyltransferase
MPDQRIITSTLQNIAAALESLGEQRPPGMIVVGWSVLALWGKGDVGVLDEGSMKDNDRIKVWLGDTHWRIKEGLDVGWDAL